MWASKTVAGALIATAFIPSAVTVYDKARPIVTELKAKPLFLGAQTYRVALSGTLRRECNVEGGSARLLAAPEGKNDLGQWEFSLTDMETDSVSLEIRLVCRKTQRRQQTLGPIKVRSPITGKGN